MSDLSPEQLEKRMLDFLFGDVCHICSKTLSEDEGVPGTLVEGGKTEPIHFCDDCASKKGVKAGFRWNAKSE